jgi:hypothetical protein
MVRQTDEAYFAAASLPTYVVPSAQRYRRNAAGKFGEMLASALAGNLLGDELYH